VRNVMSINRGFEIFEIGYIALHETNAASLIVVHDLMQAARIFLQIVDPGVIAALEKGANYPAADAAVAAGKKNSHGKWPQCHLRLGTQRLLPSRKQPGVFITCA